MSELILQELGVNQGGNASPAIFRKYLEDLGKYLETKTGVVLSEDEILLHLLWADDLILASTRTDDAQHQLNGLSKYCSKNQSIVNGMKTKFMVFGNLKNVTLYFNDKRLEQVTEYKYVGNIIREIRTQSSDIFLNNYTYLSNKSRKAIYALQGKVRSIGPLSPQLMIYLFDTMVRPIMTYGSGVWGCREPGRDLLDKVHTLFLRIVLNVKATTSNIITYGECGSVPPSVNMQQECLLYFFRVQDFPSNSLIKQAYIENKRLQHLGFKTWYGRVSDLANQHRIDLDQSYSKRDIKLRVLDTFKKNWYSNLFNLTKNPILRTYNKIKSLFLIEPYLYLVKHPKYRNAITKLRASSHTLEIERGRHTIPKTGVHERLCASCHSVEDESHFLMHCKRYDELRENLLNKIKVIMPESVYMSSSEMFCFLLCNTDSRILTLVGKFIYNAFLVRNA